MSSLNFAPNKSGALITVSTKNKEWGSVRVASEVTAIDNTTGFIRTVKKSFLIKDKVANLENFINSYPNGLPGQLVVVEFVESQMPAEFSKLLNKNLSYEDSIAQYVKRAGTDGPELTVGGERIFRYTKYDPSNSMFDVSVAHDNVEEVAAYNDAKKAQFAG